MLLLARIARGRARYDGRRRLFFSLADSKNDPSSYKDQDAQQTKKADETGKKTSGKKDSQDDTKKKEAIDFTVELTDRTGNAARLPLSYFAKMQRQVEADVAKASFMTDVPSSEVVYQTFDFPLADFVAANNNWTRGAAHHPSGVRQV